MAHEYSIYQITGIITSILSISSIVGAMWLIRASYRKKIQDKEDRDFLVNDYVFYMSIWDLLTHILTFMYWLAIGFDAISFNWEQHQSSCTILGFIFQLSLISSSTWSVYIVYNLCRLMTGSNDEDLKSKPFCNIPLLQTNHVIVWSVALICTLIPIDKYGLTHNPESEYGMDEYECWIKDKWFQMALWCPISVYLLFSLVILIWNIWIICGNWIFGKKNIRKIPLQTKLTCFSAWFFIVYFFPTLSKYWSLITDNPNQGVVVLHHILLSCIGLGNCLIWMFIGKVSKVENKSIISEHDDSFNQLLMNDEDDLPSKQDKKLQIGLHVVHSNQLLVDNE